MNGLKRLYVTLPQSTRSKIKEDLEAHGEQHQRLSYWINKEDADLLQMPTILKQIVCDNVPPAEELFKLPSLKSETI